MSQRDIPPQRSDHRPGKPNGSEGQAAGRPLRDAAATPAMQSCVATFQKRGLHSVSFRFRLILEDSNLTSARECKDAARSRVVGLLPAAGAARSGPRPGRSARHRRSLFEPIPEQPPGICGCAGDARAGRARQDAVLRATALGSHTISCNSCHLVGSGGVDMLRDLVGHRWQRVGEMPRPCSTRCSTPRSSGIGRAKDLEERADRWSIRSRWRAVTSTSSSS